jgi:hypothetical protein
MLINRLRKPNEKGLGFTEGCIIGIAILAVIAFIVVFSDVLNKNIGVSPIAKSTQALFEAQGYDLELEEVESLIGNSDFLTTGGKGPEATITLGQAGEIEVYLDVDANQPPLIPVLKYANDNSLVASPKLIPEDIKEKW